MSPPAHKGNDYATKSDEEKRTSKIEIPVTPREKAQVVRAAKAAGGLKLAAYVRQCLKLQTED
ncbi:MAG: hypothetical protein AAGJ81_10560 [Verrucomicrobiota bacterium]